MQNIVCKFGGSSLADPVHAAKAIAIIKSDPCRKCIVVSAPGRRYPSDDKVTDLLLSWHRRHHEGKDASAVAHLVQDRYAEIVAGLGLDLPLGPFFERLAATIAQDASQDFVASRGEYLMAFILSKVLGYQFVDAADCIRIEHNGRYNEYLSHDLIAAHLDGRPSVMPGFYGFVETDHGKEIKTFSRNASDLSGAIVAAALRAERYEIWTDVSGLRVADPRLVPDALPLVRATYREARELCYGGAEVIHPEALYPVQKARVPTRVLNTEEPRGPFTEIVSDELNEEQPPGTIIGITARVGFSMVTVYKPMMNGEIGFLRRLLEPFERHGINVEHAPTSVDTACVIVRMDEFMAAGPGRLAAEIERHCEAEVAYITSLALLSVVGRSMHGAHGVMARLTSAISGAGASHRAVVQSGSEMNIVVMLDSDDIAQVVPAVYREFFANEAAAKQAAA